MDVSPHVMMVSVAAALHSHSWSTTTANRALMGANMQRQAVPLTVTTAAPLVGYRHGDASAAHRLRRHASWPRAPAPSIRGLREDLIVRLPPDEGGRDSYRARASSMRSNPGNCTNQRAIVDVGDRRRGRRRAGRRPRHLQRRGQRWARTLLDRPT